MARFIECFEKELELIRALQVAGLRQRLDPDELGSDLCQSLSIEIRSSLCDAKKEGARVELPYIGTFVVRREGTFFFEPSPLLCDDLSLKRFRLETFLCENPEMAKLWKKKLPPWKLPPWKRHLVMPLNEDLEPIVWDDLMLELFAAWLLHSAMRKDPLLKRVSFEKIQEALFLFIHDVIVCGYSIELPTVGVFGPLGFDPDEITVESVRARSSGPTEDRDQRIERIDLD